MAPAIVIAAHRNILLSLVPTRSCQQGTCLPTTEKGSAQVNLQASALNKQLCSACHTFVMTRIRFSTPWLAPAVCNGLPSLEELPAASLLARSTRASRATVTRDSCDCSSSTHSTVTLRMQCEQFDEELLEVAASFLLCIPKCRREIASFAARHRNQC
jgi:hypothetical protein